MSRVLFFILIWLAFDVLFVGYFVLRMKITERNDKKRRQKEFEELAEHERQERIREQIL